MACGGIGQAGFSSLGRTPVLLLRRLTGQCSVMIRPPIEDIEGPGRGATPQHSPSGQDLGQNSLKSLAGLAQWSGLADGDLVRLSR